MRHKTGFGQMGHIYIYLLYSMSKHLQHAYNSLEAYSMATSVHSYCRLSEKNYHLAPAASFDLN